MNVFLLKVLSVKKSQKFCHVQFSLYITQDINTIGIDRQDLMKSLKEHIFESYT